MLTPAQIEAREGRLTASRVACLMTGDEAKILDLWRSMIGDPTYAEPDFSSYWPVRLGEATEQLSLDWYERKKERPVTRRGEVVIHPSANWAACTLDGWDEGLTGPIEAKHVGGREPIVTVIQRYQPQLHWQMLITGARLAALSIIEGAGEPIVESVPYDDVYGAELWRRAEAFMRCVDTLTSPVAEAVVPPPVVPERAYDFTGKNAWADGAATWLETAAAAKKAAGAEKSLKALVPADAKRVHGHGIEISRDRAGRLHLKELAA